MTLWGWGGRGGMKRAPLMPAEGMRDAPGRGFSDGGDHPGASLKTGTGLLRWDLLTCIPGSGPHRALSPLQHTSASALPPTPGARGSCGLCPGVEMQPHLPALGKPPTSRCIPPLSLNLPSSQSRAFPAQGNTAAPSPASLQPGKLGLSGYLPPRICSYGSETVNDFTAATSQLLQPRWVSTL